MVAFARTRWPAHDDAHRFACQDANFNVTAVVDGADGDVVERYRYDPYGRVTFLDGADDRSDGDDPEWDPDDDGYSDVWMQGLYAGYRWDLETGLYDVRHRVLHPTLGRWVQRDPIGYASGLGLFVYAMNRPLGLTDPLGLICEGKQGEFWQFGVPVRLDKTPPLPTPIPGLKLEFSGSLVFRAKGKRCCVTCRDGTRDYGLEGTLGVRGELKVGATLGLNERLGPVDLFLGIRAYAGLRGEGKGTLEYDPCADALTYGYSSDRSGFGGLEGGGYAKIAGRGAEAMVGGRAMVTLSDGWECSGPACEIHLARINLQLRGYARARVFIFENTIGVEKDVRITEGLRFKIPSPRAVSEAIRRIVLN